MPSRAIFFSLFPSSSWKQGTRAHYCLARRINHSGTSSANYDGPSVRVAVEGTGCAVTSVICSTVPETVCFSVAASVYIVSWVGGNAQCPSLILFLVSTRLFKCMISVW